MQVQSCKRSSPHHQVMGYYRLPHLSIHRDITPGQIMVDDRPYRRRTNKLYNHTDPYR